MKLLIVLSNLSQNGGGMLVPCPNALSATQSDENLKTVSRPDCAAKTTLGQEDRYWDRGSIFARARWTFIFGTIER